MRTDGRFARAVAVALSLYVLVSVVRRMRYGIDFTDEAFYIAMPLRFALGDKPFVDELNLTQTAALILYPFVKAYVSLVGSTKGIFFFVRVLYVVLLAVVGRSLLELGAAVRLPLPAAIVVSATALCYVPYGLPGLGYNVLGAAFLALGCLTAARASLLRSSSTPKLGRDPMFWAGASCAAAACAYPSLVLAAIVAGIAVFATTTRERLRTLARYVSGGLAFAALVAPVFLLAGPTRVREAVYYTSQAFPTEPGHLWKIIAEFEAQHPQLWKVAALVAFAIAIARRWPTLGLACVPFLPAMLRGSAIAPYMANMAYVSVLAVLGPLFGFALRDARTARALMLVAWLPCAVGGLATAWSSTNGVVASAIGAYGAALASALMMAIWIVDTAQRCRLTFLRPVAAFLPAVLTLELRDLVVEERAIYRDAARPYLTARVTSGPYKGLFTTPSKKAYLDAMARDIATYARGDRVLFFYDFPAGYLIAQKRPLAASAWIFPLARRADIDAQHVRREASSGELIVRVDPGGAPLPIDGVISEIGRPIARRNGYELYIVR